MPHHQPRPPPMYQVWNHLAVNNNSGSQLPALSQVLPGHFAGDPFRHHRSRQVPFTINSFKMDRLALQVPPPPPSNHPAGNKRLKTHNNHHNSNELDPAVQACIVAAMAANSSATPTGEASKESPVRPSRVTTTASVSYSSATTTTQALAMNFRNFSINLGARSTHLTSNQHGTATSDKQYYAGVMTDALIIASTGLLESFTPEYTPTVNNKLKPLKFMEFLQERLQMHFCATKRLDSSLKTWPAGADLACFYRLPDGLMSQYGKGGRYHILLRGTGLSIYIYRGEERLISQDSSARDGVLNEELHVGDIVMILRGRANAGDIDSIAREIAQMPPGSDLDAILEESCQNIRGLDGLMVAVLGSEFDEYFALPEGHVLKHLLHTEAKGNLSTDEPWTYAMTKHAFLLRPQVAMIYSDASKINRFTPTIDFVIRKVMAAGVGSLLRRQLVKLSDVQFMAGVILLPGRKMRYWSTSGAFILRICGESGQVQALGLDQPGQDWNGTIHVPVGECDYQSGDLIYLLGPGIKADWTPEALSTLLANPQIKLSQKITTLLGRFDDERAYSRSAVGVFEII